MSAEACKCVVKLGACWSVIKRHQDCLTLLFKAVTPLVLLNFSLIM